MSELKQLLFYPITFHPIWLIGLIIGYIVLYRVLSRDHFVMRMMRMFPTLLHEFGHGLLCQLTRGKLVDIVIVTSRKEMYETNRYGYAVTRMTGFWNQFFTMIAGYLFPPLILLISIYCIVHHMTVIFWIVMLFIFAYYWFHTSRKLMPTIVLLILFSLIYLSMQAESGYTASIVITVLYHLMMSILIADTVLTVTTLTTLLFKDYHGAWDAKQLSKLTKVPVFVFYFVFIAMNLYALYFAGNYVFIVLKTIFL